MAEVQTGTETNGTNAVKAPALVFSALKTQLLVEAPKANDAVEFYKTAFGAEEINRSLQPKRKAEQDVPLVLSADLKLGSSVFSVADSSEVKNVSGIVFALEIEDVDGTIAKAIESGAVAVGEVTEKVGGAGRVGTIKDPYGFTWVISSPSKVANVEA